MRNMLDLCEVVFAEVLAAKAQLLEVQHTMCAAECSLLTIIQVEQGLTPICSRSHAHEANQPCKKCYRQQQAQRETVRWQHTAADTASLMAAVLQPPATNSLPAMAPCVVPLLRASPGPA